MLLVLFVIAMLVSIFVVPLGLPGTFIMVAIAIALNYFAAAGIGWLAIGVGLALAVIAEVLEWTMSASFARKYGGSRRAGWGAIIGGLCTGADLPVSIATIAEVADDSNRGKLVSFSQVLWTMGIVIPLALVSVIGNMGHVGGQIIFAHVGVIAILVLVARLTTPRRRDRPAPRLTVR